MLLALAVAIIGDRGRVDDIMQEAFARVLRNGRSFADRSETLKYLRAAVINTAIDHYRRQRRYLDTFRTPGQGLEAQGDLLTPLQMLLHKEKSDYRRRLLERLRECVERLEPEDRDALDIFFGPRSRPVRDYCRERGTTYAALRRRMQRAIDRLRVQLRQEAQELQWCLEDEGVEMVLEEET